MELNYFFLHFPTEKIDKLIATKEEAKQISKTIQLIIDRIDCEKNTKIFYQSSNKDNFFEKLHMVYEMGNFGIADLETTINKILHEAKATNWEQKHTFEDSCLYRIWNIDNRILEEELIDSLKYILDTENNQTESINNYIIISILDKPQYSRPFLSAYKDYLKQINKPTFIHIPYTHDFYSLENWLDKNIKMRELHTMDFRHQEHSPKYIKDKSPLLYDLRNTKDQNSIQSLLNTAVGDARKRKYLINFDEEKGCYIRFEYEGDNPQNKYHAYHLVKPITHERDSIAENLIPYRIIEILEYRKK